ncbi:general substrate transporter [Cutaneotrichosporon oleaginosum]|uniref:General substrate transporter n=1 Tax=Cutaneotrichosporon oleaginosum TaxID=879819 RepID=A0A0J1BE87_9TREE|nr:general substrate transporter [Cutaneotrichosporon oleaginosum]KLT46394.1 general substrate transporter [Cutaneotrichosporon oleaginosum]TXT15236.1 hypothetical protein COLE_01429 [Cutaneotrichosporon oleaginosum]
MAGGGVKKPINIFRLGDLGEPKGVFNWRLWFSVFSFSILGAARGIDEGLITGAFNSKHFQHLIHYDTMSASAKADLKGNISSMVLLGSIAGSLFAFVVCDRIGRLWATRQLVMWWAFGISLFMGSNGNLGMIYSGRFIAGIGIGMTAVVGPLYLAEIAPASVRGLCTCMFTGMVYLGINVAYFTNFGMQRNYPNGAVRWLVPTSIHLWFASAIFILSWFQHESPRYLVMRGRVAQAQKVMSRLRRQAEDSEYIRREIASIVHAHDLEVEATRGMNVWQAIKKTLSNKQYLFRLYLTTSVQFLSQWSGAGSITIYAPDLFELLGVQGTNLGLLVTAVFGLIKLCAAVFCALFLVDVIGRKRSLLIGISLQIISIAFVSGFLSAFPSMGSEDYVLPDRYKAVSRVAIAMIYVSGCGWALGWNSMQYLLTAEIFPLNIRAVATSWAMMLHFINQWASARAVPTLLLDVRHGGITPAGTFWSFTCVTIIGGAWVWFFVPETAGYSLEAMDELFKLPWYKIGRYGNRFAAERAERRPISPELEEKDEDAQIDIETARKAQHNTLV